MPSLWFALDQEVEAVMTDATLAKWLREELRGPDGEYADGLVALLREAGQRLDRLLDELAALGAARLDDDAFTARLRAVLGEGHD